MSTKSASVGFLKNVSRNKMVMGAVGVMMLIICIVVLVVLLKKKDVHEESTEDPLGAPTIKAVTIQSPNLITLYILPSSVQVMNLYDKSVRFRLFKVSDLGSEQYRPDSNPEIMRKRVRTFNRLAPGKYRVYVYEAKTNRLVPNPANPTGKSFEFDVGQGQQA